MSGKCPNCATPWLIGTFSAICPICSPEYLLPCGFCRAAYLYCRCDGVSRSDEARFEKGWRPDLWDESAQAALDAWSARIHEAHAAGGCRAAAAAARVNRSGMWTCPVYGCRFKYDEKGDGGPPSWDGCPSGTSRDARQREVAT